MRRSIGIEDYSVSNKPFGINTHPGLLRFARTDDRWNGQSRMVLHPSYARELFISSGIISTEHFSTGVRWVQGVHAGILSVRAAAWLGVTKNLF